MSRMKETRQETMEWCSHKQSGGEGRRVGIALIAELMTRASHRWNMRVRNTPV